MVQNPKSSFTAIISVTLRLSTLLTYFWPPCIMQGFRNIFGLNSKRGLAKSFINYTTYTVIRLKKILQREI